MAEHVQTALDQMVAPLQDLQERGVFSATEIHAIVDRRRESEYALRRRSPRKADFLRYLQAEMDLEKLRQLRSKRLLKQQQQEKGALVAAVQANNTKHIGDKHVIQHIHLLWIRTLRKYRSDVSLYLEYAEFCKETHSWRKLSRCYAEALQMHPKQTGLWIEAASHAFFQAGSVPNARVMMQRALRINPKAADVWLQYFGLELHFIQKMQGRRAILMGNGDGKKDKPENDIATLKEPATDQWDAYRMPTVVYDNAIKAISDSVAFRLQFLDQCSLFPGTETMQSHIVTTIQRDCEGQAEAWIARAMYAWEKQKRGATTDQTKGFVRSDADQQEDDQQDEPSSKRRRSVFSPQESDSDPVLAVLEEATRTLKTQDMFLQAIGFARSYLEQLHVGDSDDEEQAENVQARVQGVQTFLEHLLKEATDFNFDSTDIILARVDYLQSCDKPKNAIQELEHFVESKSSAEKVPAAVWIKWASLVLPQSTPSAVAILERAIKQIPMANSDHMIVALELLGLKLMANGGADSWNVFQRILLLAPGFIEMEDIEEPLFGISNVSSACLIYLRHNLQEEGVTGARLVYDAALFQSSACKLLAANGDESIKAFVDEAIQVEMIDKPNEDAKKRLRRLFEAVVELFSDTPYEDEYRRRRDDVIVYGRSMKWMVDVETKTISVPFFDVAAPGFRTERLDKAFQKYQLIHLRNAGKQVDKRDKVDWKGIGRLFGLLNADDQDSWCVETQNGPKLSAETFLAPKLTKARAYGSFLIQSDKNAYKTAVEQLPLQELGGTQWYYEPALWLFFGRNAFGNNDLEGRPEHTDSVSHDGTWHYQLSGTKHWYLRPSPKLMAHFHTSLPPSQCKALDESMSVRLDCAEGDVIVINTRLWFHRTVVPAQKRPSVSYARDFRRTKPLAAQNGSDMKNVDGLYATKDIQAGSVIFTENDMPDCELHRSSANPNCEVVDLEDGTNAVVSRRSIPEGEFFCIAESSDEEECSDDDSSTSDN